jgi:hypothetical protein
MSAHLFVCLPDILQTQHLEAELDSKRRKAAEADEELATLRANADSHYSLQQVLHLVAKGHIIYMTFSPCTMKKTS